MNIEEITAIPTYGWKVKLNHVFSHKRTQFRFYSLRQIFSLLPLVFRYIIYYVKLWYHGSRPGMDFLRAAPIIPYKGVPLGGIGCGTIGTKFQGGFTNIQMIPGSYEFPSITFDAAQFIVNIQDKNNDTLYQKVLSCQSKPRGKKLSSWEWDFPGEEAEYIALYPRSWTVFNIPEQKIKLVCRQISPIIPKNYMDSSVPGGVFHWSVYNYNSDDRNISITFTFQSGSGVHSHKTSTVSTKTFQENSGLIDVCGVIIEQKIDDYPQSYGIATKKQANGSTSYFLYFNPNDSGNDIWKTLKANGELHQFTSTNVSKADNEEMACAVCYRSCVPSDSSSDYIFTLTWDMPKFGFSTQTLKRFYTKYFGEDGNAVPQLSSYCISNYLRWEKEICNWQRPILQNKSLPDWYKSALFNELYYISDGGTIWTLIDSNEKLSQHDPRIEYGRFAYLEGHEYRMYNTYDVHFYASCSLISLWPKLQLSLQYDFCDAIGTEDKTRTWFLYNGKHGYRKVKDTVPHDLGDPDENPFILINSYPIHDVSTWRDLNLKYVLQVYRDYVITKDVQYVVDMFPQVVIVIKHAMTWDSDNDGMIENSGYPDQTYDAWVMSGTSAYCGSLWLAALYVTISMANMIGEHDIANELSDTLTKGKHSFEKKLWNGTYYNFDSSGGAHSTSIMADQLCGLWYLHCCNIEQNVFNPTYVQHSLKYIYEKNVCGYFDGSQGAVNGMFPNGKIDRSAVQSEEVWTGVTYALASLLIFEGLADQGFKTAQGLYDTVYNKSGLGFATPEALYETNSFRALSYMRALSIWSMQMAIEFTTSK